MQQAIFGVLAMDLVMYHWFFSTSPWHVSNDESPLTFVVSTHIAFENCLALNSSGGDLCNFQAYDRTHAMTVRLSDHPEINT